ncbi:CBS domain-containing protein [Halorussus lipolyticus]|uniref:CBS domain-containing protein n=1 Tax=Halorussus lipolyticus TaxID=3034024 RepID=UPI0023E8F22F|nr:CBS domain-containing protein [Halorussus sp. DT80]
MQVSELMTPSVIAISETETIREASKRMIRYGVGSIIVVAEGNPVGIVTQTDVMEAGAATDKPFSKLPVKKVMTSPVVTVRPTATVREAVELMEEHGVKHLPVADGELHGMVTTSDVVMHHEELVTEFEALRESPPTSSDRETTANSER